MPRSEGPTAPPRALAPEDLYRFRIPSDLNLSPDGRFVAFTVQTVAPSRDGYRHAVWLAPTDGSAPARRLTIGAKHDTSPRFSPDGRFLAFLSDRRLAVEEMPNAPKEREDGTQVHLLPLEGGEAYRLTDLPRGVRRLEWSPDSRRMVVVSTSLAGTREADLRRRGRRPAPPTDGEPPESDYRYIDRLQYMLNGAGFLYDQVPHLWVVDAATGDARRLTSGAQGDDTPAWSPDGTRIAFASNREPNADLSSRSDIWVVDADSGSLTRLSGSPRGLFSAPTWLPDGSAVAALGHRFPAGAGSRQDIWLFAADGSDSGVHGGRNLSSAADLMPGSTMNSDIVPGEEPQLHVSTDGAWITFTAPVRGSYELWRIAIAGGAIERITSAAHYISAFDQVDLAGGTSRIACLRSTPTSLSDVFLLELEPGTTSLPAAVGHARSDLRPLTNLNAAELGSIDLVEPLERWLTVDGYRIQGWVIESPGRSGGRRPGPLVVEIHGGPQTLYGWSPVLEFQVLAASGMSVWYCNPRGSEGYGQDFAAANFRDWGPGPTRDVLAGVDELVAEGLADPDRLGVTGGSYGGYLTNWIIGHDQRFAAALTARSVSDLSALMITGDLSGGEFGRLEFGANAWEEPELYREASPLTYADRIHTPLLIQHAEIDLRCPIGQAEALFSILRTLRRPVRFMRVPGESHELTRSGTPFRRVENLVQVRDWFRHFLVEGKRRLPPVPRPAVRA